MKKLAFTKQSGKTDEVTYFDGIAAITTLQNPKQGILPHDFVHAIVESCLKIRGFTELIFGGVKAEFAMMTDGEAWLAESIDLDSGQFRQWVESICAQRGVVSVKVREEQFLQLKGVLAIYGKKWQELASGDRAPRPQSHSRLNQIERAPVSKS